MSQNGQENVPRRNFLNRREAWEREILRRYKEGNEFHNLHGKMRKVEVMRKV